VHTYDTAGNYRATLTIVGGDGATTSASARTTVVDRALPTARTGAATNVGATTATLNAHVVPNSDAITARFRWGTDPANLDRFTTKRSLPRESDFSADLTGLAPSTTYYYEVVAVNALGKTTGSVFSFVTTP
jgi:PKD repeat protein